MSIVEDGFLVPSLERDGKIIVTPFPASEGYKTWFTGAGDQLSPLVRGGGQRIKLAWDAAEPRGAKSIDLRFAEPVEMHDGGAHYVPVVNWGVDDLMTVKVVLPATVTTASGAGNCNKVPSGLGYDIVVPAPGNGGFNVDLAVDAVPVPAKAKDGFWDVDYNTGIIKPSVTPGAAGYHLLALEVTATFLRNVPLGHSLGEYNIDAYKVEYIHPRWLIRITVDKQSAGAGDFAGWLLMFRENLT
jgi:hypothetical protein